MICPNCGSQNSDDVSQCVFCGQRFAPKDPQPDNNQNSGQASNNDDYYTSGETRNDNGSSSQWQGFNNSQNSQNRNNNPNSQNWNNNPDSQYWNNNQNNQGWYNQQNNQGFNNNQPYWQNQPPKQPANSFALASMIVGIASIFFMCFLPYLSIPLDIVGIVLGIIALKKGGGKGMAIAGIIISAVILVAGILMLVSVFYMMSLPEFQKIFNEIYEMQGL
ncbi:MAG: DUF4190 domain-containing protein [Clostridiales bacterium]|nr:DUF4190 domain-containing protein [Clostridiales bacterium]MDY3747440.1 hypothetical protein [Lachnospiraceae bacterium]